MSVVRWIIVVIAVIEAGWMAFDGTRGLVVGDYVRPRSGQYAGQLGPWAPLVRRVGIDPESTLMKTTFAVYGFGWLVIIAAFAMRAEWAWWAMLAAALGAVWYLVPGTLCSIAQIVLLLIMRMGPSR